MRCVLTVACLLLAYYWRFYPATLDSEPSWKTIDGRVRCYLWINYVFVMFGSAQNDPLIIRAEKALRSASPQGPAGQAMVEEHIRLFRDRARQKQLIRFASGVRARVYELDSFGPFHLIAISRSFLAELCCALAAMLWIRPALRFMRRNRYERRNRCVECGYSLIGLPQDRCPECGTQFERHSRALEDARNRSPAD